MDQSPTERNPHLALRAYTLGYSPVMLELDARWRWEMAELAEEPLLESEGGDEETGFPEEDSRFPVELARHLREIQDAGDALVDALPRSSRGQLSKGLADALELAWRAYEEGWLGPKHRARIREREAAEGGVDMLKASPFVGPAWRDFRRAVQAFGDSLQEPLRTWAALGTHLAAVAGILPHGFRQDPLPEQVSPAPYPMAAELLQKVKASHPVLEGLELHSTGGLYERHQEARELHDQIQARLAESGEVTAGGHEQWITASKAVAVARGMGVPRSLSWIGKTADRRPAPFKSQSGGGRRRNVELVSFMVYLLEEYERASDEAANPVKGQPKFRPKPQIQAQIESCGRKENEGQERRNEVANQAREEAKKKPGDR